jgi:hypothetical protein
VGLGAWWSQQSDVVKAAMIAGVLAIIGGAVSSAVTGGFGLFSSAQHPTASPSTPGVSTAPPSRQQSSSPRTTLPANPSSATAGPSCAKHIKITAPKAGTSVIGTKGVLVTGTSCGLAVGDSVWVFEHDPFDGMYYAVYDPDVGFKAVSSHDGGFTILDKPIGDPGDADKRYAILALLANSQCSKGILATKPDSSENYVFQVLPAGCVVGDQTEILESQPGS